MKGWDLNSGAVKLRQAMDTLQKTVLDVTEHWDDATARKFRETYLAPLGPDFRTAVEAIERLQEVIARAEHECGDEGER